MENKIKMIALDTSLRSSDYSIFSDGKLIEIGNLIVDDKDCAPIDEMISKISVLLNNTNPDIVVVENTVVIRNTKVMRLLTEIIGGIRFWCVSHNKFFYILNPTEWRKLVKEPNEILPKKRNELKIWSMNTVKRYTRRKINNDDVIIEYNFREELIIFEIIVRNLVVESGT